MSFDVNPTAGGLVREGMRTGWTRVFGATSETLLRSLDGRRVGILFQDTLHSVETQRLEFEAALANSAQELVLVDCSGGQVETLHELCTERGGSYHRVPIRPRAHVHPGGTPASGGLTSSDSTSRASSRTLDLLGDDRCCVLLLRVRAGGRAVALHALGVLEEMRYEQRGAASRARSPARRSRRSPG